MSEALSFESTIPQPQIVHWNTSSVHENCKLKTCCLNKLVLFVFDLTFRTRMNNLLSYCGLVDARISASDLLVKLCFQEFSEYESTNFFYQILI